MSNKGKTLCKKYVIRNAEESIPKSVIQQPEVLESVEELNPTRNEPQRSTAINFAIPEQNSTQYIIKKIKQIESIKPTKIKSVQDLGPASRMTYNENITKQMNFPLEKRLYKELVSLQNVCDEKPTTAAAPGFTFESIRDPVPQLEDFFTPLTKPEYLSLPNNNVINFGQNLSTTVQHYHGNRLYQVMSTWN